MVAEGDRVAVLTRVRGSNQGGFLGVEANGNPFEIAAIGIYTLRDGKIMGHWGLNDGVSLMQQLPGAPAE